VIHHTWTSPYVAENEHDDAASMKYSLARWLSEKNIDGEEWEEREEDLNKIFEGAHKGRDNSQSCSRDSTAWLRTRRLEPMNNWLISCLGSLSFHQHSDIHERRCCFCTPCTCTMFYNASLCSITTSACLLCNNRP
jgi:hypothetical protein